MENSILQAVRQKQAIQGVCFSWTAWGRISDSCDNIGQTCWRVSARPVLAIRRGGRELNRYPRWKTDLLVAWLVCTICAHSQTWSGSLVGWRIPIIMSTTIMRCGERWAERRDVNQGRGYNWEAAPSPFLLRLFVCCVCSFSCICSFVTFFLLFSFDHLFVCSFVLLFVSCVCCVCSFALWHQNELTNFLWWCMVK